MTALGRIKELVDLEKRGDWPIEHEDGVFLLKAFLVMRDMCAERSGYNWVDMDKEFELRMR